MKKTAIATLAIAMGLWAAPADAGWGVSISGPHGNISFGESEYFEYGGGTLYSGYHDVLSGYGRWVYVAGTGEMWVPYVSTTWRPYSYGRWVWSSYGWTWISYEPWGYVPHHYGSWQYLSSYGWCWQPGYTWRPAHVQWYTGGGYVGWYPAGINITNIINVNVNINITRIVNIVRPEHLDSDRLLDRYVSDRTDRRLHDRIVGHFRSPGRSMMEAPTRAFVERHVNRRIETVTFEEKNVRVGERSVRVLAPTGRVKDETLRQAKEVVPAVLTPPRKDKPVREVSRGHVEPRRETRVEPRHEPRVTPKRETRVEPRHEPRVTPKREARVEPRHEPRVTPKREARVEPRHEPRVTPKRETRVEPRREPRVTPKRETRVEPRREPRVTPKRETRVEPRREPRVTPKRETRVEPRHEPRVAPKPAAKSEVKESKKKAAKEKEASSERPQLKNERRRD